MNIPDKAVEAAANAMVSASPDLSGWDDLNQAEIDWYMRDARAALEAAAPFIAAQALRDAAFQMKDNINRLEGDSRATPWLARVNDIGLLLKLAEELSPQ